MTNKRQATILLINGPPGSGKDTIADMVYSLFMIHPSGGSAMLRKFADPLISALQIQEGYARKVYYEVSKRLNPAIRERAIMLSEAVIKPEHGDGVFGAIAAARAAEDIAAGHRMVIFSDSGFAAEIKAFIHMLESLTWRGIPVHIWSVHRQGTSFQGDSRERVGAQTVPLAASYEEVQNYGTLEDLENTVKAKMNALIPR